MKRALKLKIWARDKYRCTYCGEKLTQETATTDHIKPRVYKGKTEEENLTTACRPCNFKKSLSEGKPIIYR